MKKLREMNITEFEKEYNKAYRLRAKLETREDTIGHLLDKKRQERYNVKKDDIIVGRAKVFKVMRNIVAKVYKVVKEFDWNEDREILKAIVYTSGEKKYEFKLNSIRKASKKECEKFKIANKKYHDSFRVSIH